MKDYFGYQGKVCVVTGASSGMGKAATEMLVDLGAKVYALDVNPCEVEGIEKFIAVNLSEKESIDAAFHKIPEQIDSFFGIAGVSGLKCDFNTTVSIDLLANTYITEEYLLNRMPKGGAISYITSTGGQYWEEEGNKKYYLPVLEARGYENKMNALNALNFNQLPGNLGYVFSKMAMNYYVQYILQECGPKGIRVNAVLPGSTDTGMKDEFETLASGAENLISYTGYANRLARSEEMGMPVVFLNSDMASFISGELLNVDYGVMNAKQYGFAQGMKITFDMILSQFAKQ